MEKEVIIALDFENGEKALGFLEAFEGERPFVKVGMELFYMEGPDIVRELKKRGMRVFLDLKLHDIPNTVEKAMRSLSGLHADIVNLHASGGSAMMKAALSGLHEGADGGSRPLLIAVTELTSIDKEILKNELLIDRSLDEVVADYALMAKNSGLDGVVCSAHEAAKVHDICGKSFLVVTPGIRFADGDPGDQKRVMTPSAAGEAGSDMIVVGRAVTGSSDPLAAYRRCVSEFRGLI